MDIKPPQAEILIGMETYKSHSPGIGGRIKELCEDFIVEEITEDRRVLEVGKGFGEPTGPVRDNLLLTMEKYNWDTLRAINELSRHLHVSTKRIGFAGTKDKKALTTQRLSVYGARVEDFAQVKIKDIIFRDFFYSGDNIALGSLYGNRFTLTIRNLDDEVEEIKRRTTLIIEELRSQAPAFYGLQRFGTVRPITHLVGRELLRGDFREAVMVYLAKDFPGEDETVRVARKRLQETGDFNEALKNFPSHLSYEHALLNHLVQKPDDYLGAIRVLPKTLGKMFLHAHQAYIFNKALSEYIRRGIPVERLPLPGYGTEVDEVTERIMGEEGVKREDYKIKGAFDLSSKGEYRDCFVPVEDLNVLDASKDEVNSGKNKLKITFSLSKGNYATVLLREVMKN